MRPSFTPDMTCNGSTLCDTRLTDTAEATEKAGVPGVEENTTPLAEPGVLGAALAASPRMDPYLHGWILREEVDLGLSSAGLV